MKTCSKCLILKENSEFYKHSLTKDKLFNSCKSCVLSSSKTYYLKNKENVNKRHKQYREEKPEIFIKFREEHRDEANTYNKIYYQVNKEKLKKEALLYAKNNREKVNKYRNKKRQIDPIFKLSTNLRSRIHAFIKKYKFNKSKKFIEYIGCSLDELKEHIEKQFQNNMTWYNYGQWHIDHKIPLASAKTTEEVYQLCHYTNLQPLWAADNISKGKKTPLAHF